MDSLLQLLHVTPRKEWAKWGLKSKGLNNGLMILNYEQVPPKGGWKKDDPLLRLCRQLVIDTNTWTYVARSFTRFFNLGEHSVSDQLLQQAFEQKNEVRAYEKFDGSLIMTFYHKDQWTIVTRGAPADGNPLYRSKKTTYGALVRMHLPLDKMDPNKIYVWELCVPGEHITQYDSVQLVLLAVREGMHLYTPEEDGKELGVKAAPYHEVSSIQEVRDLMAKQSADFEGYVLQFPGGLVKVKKESYLLLHRLGGQVSKDNIRRLVLMGEEDEVLSNKHLAEVHGDDIKEAVEWKATSLVSLNKIWEEHNDKETAKDFALAVKPLKHPWTKLLFMRYRGKIYDFEKAVVRYATSLT